MIITWYSSAYRKFLHDHKIDEITSHMKKDVIYVDTETTVEHTCKILGQNNISAVPILDEHQNKFIGIVDLVDIALFISFAYEQKRKDTKGMLVFCCDSFQ